MKPWGCQIQEYVGTSFKIGLIRKFKKMLGLPGSPTLQHGFACAGWALQQQNLNGKKKVI
jgi:hypothetical protein